MRVPLTLGRWGSSCFVLILQEPWWLWRKKRGSLRCRLGLGQGIGQWGVGGAEREGREWVMVSEEGIVGLLGAKVRLSVMKNLESK